MNFDPRPIWLVEVQPKKQFPGYVQTIYVVVAGTAAEAVGLASDRAPDNWRVVSLERTQYAGVVSG